MATNPRHRQDEAHRQEPPRPEGAASGGTRSKSGSNYGDWHPNEAARRPGYDGSVRSADWPAGEKEAAERKESDQELVPKTSTARGQVKRG